MASFEVKFPKEDQPSRIKKWRVSEGTMVTAGRILVHYQDVATGKAEKKMKASQFGKVTKILIKENEIVHPGQTIVLMEGCKHPTVMKDLCAECGADLQEESTSNSDKPMIQAIVPMVHSVPELKVTPELAEKIGREDKERLLKHKQLVLLVDLDQTIVHTTNDNIPADLEDVYHFQLYGPNSPWYHTRLRPHTRRFLSEVSEFYELHICTFGARQYAHKVASILDEDGKLFSHRILSRDECFDPMSKTANLKALFPCGVDMVCIIDDRDDVWQGCANLVQVKPYHYFLHTGDINVPPGLGKQDDPDPTKSPIEISQEPRGAPIADGDTDGKQNPDNLAEDHDDYLLYLEDILKRIHAEFYAGIENENIKSKSLREIIPKVRSHVLEGTFLTFSGLVPNNQKLHQSRAYKVARAFGAQVIQDLTDQTTHLVAIQPGTVKVREAKKRGRIKIVTPDWLWTCAERWEHVDERLYPLKEVPLHKAREFRKPPAHCSTPEHVEDYMPDEDTFANSINPLMAFSREEIANMDKEVEDDMSDLDDLDEESQEANFCRRDQDSDSDNVYGYDDDLPPDKKRKKSNDSDSEGHNSNGSGEVTRFRHGGDLPDDLDLGDNSQDSVGGLEADNLEDDSEWNAMGAALEREFLSDS
ncbi:hypothetical protein QAD02_015072 [Eretmocerus hayati]|uniref:Uncharacterized protein n=1 Tax=Eretmocerus hayati TaxID=131215 RepID=A0ACC2P6Q6_9HYME|nr:hypothetical protein QAD02_015072 [Eretmocerus hayati]